MRITGAMIYDQVLGDVQGAQTRLATVQERMGSGRKINRPSDDPSGTQHALDLNHALAQNETYSATAKGGADRLNATDQALSSVGQIATRVRQLVLQAANTALPDSSRTTMVTELTSLQQQLVQVANSEQAGSYLFGGTRDGSAPWSVDPLGALVYSGDTSAIQREIGPGVRVSVNVDASADIQNLYAAIGQSITDLQASNTTALGGADLQSITQAQDGLLNKRAEAGALSARMDMASDRLSAQNQSLQAMKSNTVDLDITQAALDATRDRMSLQLALQVGASLMQPTLMDFLK